MKPHIVPTRNIHGILGYVAYVDRTRVHYIAGALSLDVLAYRIKQATKWRRYK
jgi:hypothetical protein